MAFRLRSTQLRDDAQLLASAVDDAVELATATATIDGTELAALMLGTSAVMRETAHGVPAYWRARNLVCSSIAQAQLRRKLPDGRLIDGDPFMRQPDPTRTAFAFWYDIVGDLCDYGAAYAVNTGRAFRYPDATNRNRRKHVAVERVDPNAIRWDDERGAYSVTRNNATSWYAREYVIAYECAAGTWLTRAARAVLTSVLLEESARRYAETPQATTLLTNNGPRKTPEQIDQLLAAWEQARRNRSTAYAGRDITVEAIGFDASQIALESSRAQAILDIARATGIPSLYLGQGPNDASMTYSNMTQQRLDLYAAFQPFAVAIEQRMSFDDVTGQGTLARFDFGAWLRVDPTMRANIYAQLIPIGVMTVDEARSFEDLVPMTVDPAVRQQTTTPPDDEGAAP